MTKWVIRAVHMSGKKIPEQEISADWPAEALEIYAEWLAEKFCFNTRKLSCIDIDRVED